MGERSLTVGSSGTFNSDHGQLWQLLAASDEGLMTIVREWNVASVERCARRLESMCKQMLEACATGKSDTTALFGAVHEMYASNQKNVDILAEIARLSGEQICLADPIVSAVLLDEGGQLTRYEKRSAIRLNDRGQPAISPDASSRVVFLHAGGDAKKFSET